MGKWGLAMGPLGFLALPRARCCSAPGSSTCRTHSRYPRDLDLSLASTNKDAQVRRGWDGSASQGCAGWKRATHLPCGDLWGSTQRPRAQTWGKHKTGGTFAPLRCGCDVGRASKEPSSRRKQEASNTYVHVDCARAETLDPPALPGPWGLGPPREMGNNQWIKTGGTSQDRAWASGQPALGIRPLL